MTGLSDRELLDVAKNLARSAGRRPPLALERIAGGRNNRVYRAETGEAPLVLKAYHADPRDPRDRLAAEWNFIGYAWARGVRNLPEPLARDRKTRTALYGFIPGEKLKPGAVEWKHIEAAANFIGAVNVAPRRIEELAPASEACFSLAAHVATVERRLERLAVLDPEAPLRAEAAAFVGENLRPVWAAVKSRILSGAASLGIALDEELAPREVCISPSDFGFHNALADGGRMSFIDFEYAGRDDPAKLVCDFFCQPEIPAPAACFERFVGRVLDVLLLDKRGGERCALLLDAYRVKWLCILLNDFLPLGAARRGFGDMSGDRVARCEIQLGKARERIAAVSTT